MRLRLGYEVSYEEDEDGDKEWKVDLSSINPGFTLPSNIGELGNVTELQKLDLSSCSLQGASRSEQIYRTEANREANRDFPLNRVKSQTRQTPN